MWEDDQKFNLKTPPISGRNLRNPNYVQWASLGRELPETGASPCYLAFSTVRETKGSEKKGQNASPKIPKTIKVH